ncbi:N-6 DNA methylase [Streptomyces sp. NPDC058008]|uniref:N-6 DNA methylase n=1 Tax=Streptomyces sp. NPDC058008 TaxID=3346303 RepID=UPI0036E4617F
MGTSMIQTETETVITKILPYLKRRGYDPEKDFSYESALTHTERYGKGYVDILVKAGKQKPVFLVEAKRSSKRLTAKDRDQALGYGKSVGVPFVVVTNGADIQCFNVKNSQAIRWDGKLEAKVPRRDQIPLVVRTLKSNPNALDIALSDKGSLPFRPGLPLKQLNALFYRCHSKIRNIEKSEETAFSDFSKILFLKLLEEKADTDTADFNLPYSYRFHELAARPDAESDQVRDAIRGMLKSIRDMGYGDVLIDPIHLKNAASYKYLVAELSRVSFEDSGLDTKGAAFEYFVRATLKGKKLGQYFTPRPLVELMYSLVGEEFVVDNLRGGDEVRVLDPACGTGGFLVYMMKESLAQINTLFKDRKIAAPKRDELARKVMEEVFHGGDANDGVASTAKMNMIIAGDGHTNIKAGDSLSSASEIWSFDKPRYQLIMTNPPFGTSESASLPDSDKQRFDIPTTKGQLLFLQRMVKATVPGGLICSVIDEGVLNTESSADLRRWLLNKAQVVAVVELPDETFKPNKINVRSSLLFLRKREEDDIDGEDDAPITFCRLDSLGYIGSGEKIRKFDFAQLRNDFASQVLDTKSGAVRSGAHWRAADVSHQLILKDSGCRLDFKYWDPIVRDGIAELKRNLGVSIAQINSLETNRGRSPSATDYVDRTDGYAMVVKSGTNISKYGEIVPDGADWIQKDVFDDLPQRVVLKKSDVLVSSTGDGTLGKTAVYDLDFPAIGDGHVAIIRVKEELGIDPYYLADYLRCGFGQRQIQRLFTGSTGLIELTTEALEGVVVDPLSGVKEQRAVSAALRKAEISYARQLTEAERGLQAAREIFAKVEVEND